MSYPSGSGPSDLIGTPTAPIGNTYPASPTTVTENLYSFATYGINTSSFAMTGSPTLDFNNYATKYITAYIHPWRASSGSIIISGSWDGTNWYNFTSSSIASGSLYQYTFTDVLPYIQVYFRTAATGSSVCTGSLYVYGRSN